MGATMELANFEYRLPEKLIAQRPLAERDSSRMMLLDRRSGCREDRWFRELPELVRGDELFVVNNARVSPARLFGRRKGIHAQPPGRHSRVRRQFLKTAIEVLLVRQLEPDVWEALVRPGRKMPAGERVIFGDGLEAEVIGRGAFGLRRLRFHGAENLPEALDRLGHVPLPPYIRRPDEPADRDRYQTIFARVNGALAAPTAGLHFTPAILERLERRGVELAEITLEVGLGTFQPIRAARIEEHHLLPERYEISDRAAEQIARARAARRPIVAIGTTVVRALEDAAQPARLPAGQAGAGGRSPEAVVRPGRAEAGLYILPGYEFRVVDQLLTNFHLPRSSLLVLVAAFAGRAFILDAYRHAIAQGYRFYSYGDCMFLR
jgi:S-adenosylmethionine:tRNA ribosyltransferase-isomerase